MAPYIFNSLETLSFDGVIESLVALIWYCLKDELLLDHLDVIVTMATKVQRKTPVTSIFLSLENNQHVTVKLPTNLKKNWEQSQSDLVFSQK